MDPGPLLLSACVMMVCLLGGARCSSLGKGACPCPAIPSQPLTKPPPEICFEINGRYRYECIDGYVRKVGTSNLIICSQNSTDTYWSPFKLQCIPDPLRRTTQPPITTEPKGHTDIPHESTATVTASTSQQTIQSKTPPASVTAVTDSPEPTTPSPRVTPASPQDVGVTKVRHRTTSVSSTADPSNNSEASQMPGSTVTAFISLASLVIVCALIGIIIVFYRRRSNLSVPAVPTEEQIPMNDPSAAL